MSLLGRRFRAGASLRLAQVARFFAPFSVRFVLICAQNARNLQHLKNDFPLFSSTPWLRFRYFAYSESPGFPLAPGSSHLPSRRATPWPLPTTMCPHHDHNYRLSCTACQAKNAIGNGVEQAFRPAGADPIRRSLRRPAASDMFLERLAQTPAFWGLRCPEGAQNCFPPKACRRYTVRLYADLPSHLQSG